MKEIGSYELQKAVFSRLKTSNYTKDYKIFDEVKQGETYPYIVLASETLTAWDTKTSVGDEITMTIEVFSNYRGFKEIKQIANNIVKALTESDLTLESFNFALVRLEFFETVRVDENVRAGLLRFRFKIYKNI